MIEPPSITRVLLIAPTFFGYEHAIAEELQRSGQCVDILPDRPFNSPLMKAVMRFRPELGGYRVCDRFYEKSLEKLGRNHYSTILIIQGEGITAKTLTNIRMAYPRAQLIYYTWDSIENKPFSKRNLSYYDRCSTFDPVDAIKYGMSFRPLFYTEGFDGSERTEYTYDLSFIGTVHSDRYRIVSALLNQLSQDTRTFIHLYLQAPWMYDFRRIFTNTIKGGKREFFRFEPLSKDVVQTIFNESRAVLDIEHVQQRGATMRTMEALGSRRKLVTTNAMLRNYDFYNSSNIFIIDRNNPKLDNEFLCTPYERLPEDVRQQYSLRQWVSDVLGWGDIKG